MLALHSLSFHGLAAGPQPQSRGEAFELLDDDTGKAIETRTRGFGN